MMQPRPTARPGLFSIPGPGLSSLRIRFAKLCDRDHFAPATWPSYSFSPHAAFPGWWQFDLDALALEDGAWEYEFLVDGDVAVPDPWADEITRFGGYRGVFHIHEGVRFLRPFRWDNEIPAGIVLPENNQIVIYEMPVRWMSSAGANPQREVDLATFDEVIFEHLNNLQDLGINAIELLPIQDSSDTLNWGYGTRFFFAPDIDMGSAVDLKFFIKCCHQRGIRVLIDVVMNHCKKCPLEQLAKEWYLLTPPNTEGDRTSWGGTLFRYQTSNPAGFFAAREFHYEMAEFWVREFHIDGFRLDEFKSINHWEFVQTFRDRAWQAHQSAHPDRPFIVIAEDSYRRFEISHDSPENPNGRKLVEAIWNFSFRDDARRLITNQIVTHWGQPSRSDRIRALFTGSAMWDDYKHGFREGWSDLAQAINYLTSHDMEKKDEWRMMNYILVRHFGDIGIKGNGDIDDVKNIIDHLADKPQPIKDAHAETLDRIRSAFALLLTSVGIPMFLAGEEFADCHDLDTSDPDLKMSDPVNWSRRDIPGHRVLCDQVRAMIHLRTSHRALQRNELQFFYFHPDMDQDAGARVFAYARTAGQEIGADGQVAVIANGSGDSFPAFDVPWPWGNKGFREIAIPSTGSAPQILPGYSSLRMSLAPFQARVICIM
jgi:1,4-alpha-glucan branching enzyme